MPHDICVRLHNCITEIDRQVKNLWRLPPMDPDTIRWELGIQSLTVDLQYLWERYRLSVEPE